MATGGEPLWKQELLERRRRALRTVGVAATLRASVTLGQGPGAHRSPPVAPQTLPLPHTMRFLDQDLTGSELISIKCNSNSDSELKAKMVEEKPDKKTSFRSMDKSKEVKNSKALIKTKEKRDDEDYHSDSSEELQYGPGIVNKLKSKYLSMTLRDNQKHSSRPSLSNMMRRATSLENMLEDDINRLQQKPHFIKKPYHTTTHRSSKISQHHAKYLGLTRGSESMKRARSMDTLLKSETTAKNGHNQMSNSMLATTGYTNGSVTPSIINEDIIIVDNSSDNVDPVKPSIKTEDTELPPHDLVKQTLKLFEPAAKKPEVQSKVKIAVSKLSNSNMRTNNADLPGKPKITKPTLGPKPALGSKPAIPPEKRYTRQKVPSPKRVFPVVSSIEKPKAPVIAPKVLPIGEPKKFPSPLISPKISPSIETKKIVLTQTAVPVSVISNPPSSTPIKNVEPEPPVTSAPIPIPPKSQDSSFTFKETERLSISPINCPSTPDKELSADDEDKPKYISQKARDGISKEGMSMKFSFNDKPVLSDKSYLPRSVPQATNTALLSSQGDTSPVKQVAVIRPVVKNKVLTDQEIEKNLINKKKSIESKILKSDETSVVSDSKPPLWEKKTWQSQNTMVFNFSDRKSVPDYIENDGITLNNRRTPKCNGDATDGSNDLGSGEEDWDPPLTCTVRFIGDNIVINGKSSLRKEPKASKLRIQFNDEATTTFEYPSEESMSEEVTSPSPSPTQTPNPLTLGGGSLSSYTPSKSIGGEKFELGVTRTAPIAPSNQNEPSSDTTPKEQPPEEDYLKPLDPDLVSPWSQETTSSDILF